MPKASSSGKYAVVGLGIVSGQHPKRSQRMLGAEAARHAISDAGFTRHDIGGAIDLRRGGGGGDRGSYSDAFPRILGLKNGGVGTQFDALKMNWIGSPMKDTAICAVRKGSTVKTIQDLFNQELMVGGSRSGSDTAIYPAFLNGLFGLKFKLVMGYPGIQDVAVAIERTELDGICTSFSTLIRQNPYRDGKLNLLVQVTLNKDPLIPANVPLITELKMSQADRQALELFLARAEIGRPFLAPPGLPSERVVALRKASVETLADKDFIAEAKQLKLNLAPISGEEIANVVTGAYQTPHEVVKRVTDLLARTSQ